MVYSLIFSCIDLISISRLELSSNDKETDSLKMIENKLANFGIKVIDYITQLTTINIYYPKKETNINNQLLSIIQQYKDKDSNIINNFLLQRINKENDFKYVEKILTNKAEDSILSIIDKMALFTLRKKYYIKSKLFNIGDFEIKLGSIYHSEDYNATPIKTFFQIDTKIKTTSISLFLKDIVSNIFNISNEDIDSILHNKTIINDYMGKPINQDYISKSMNNHYDIFQLVELILK